MHRMVFLPPSRALYLAPILVLFLIAFAQGQGPGNCDSVHQEKFSMVEEQPPNSLVGTIQTDSSYTYSFKEPQSLFYINTNNGSVFTNAVLDREKLPSNTLQILVIRLKEGITQECPIELYITVLDINDNDPSFSTNKKLIRFNENPTTGNQVPLEAAYDPDAGENGTVHIYSIVNSSEGALDKFSLVYDEKTYGNIPYIRNIALLDREKKDFYQINISCQDSGSPPRKGFLTIDIRVEDNNDNSPVFDPSQYVASVNESSPRGTVVLRVQATDLDVGNNALLIYSLQDATDQFEINKTTGEIYTNTSPLKCVRKCERSAFSDCTPSSCFLTITVRDSGEPPLGAQAYVTVNVTNVKNVAPTLEVTYTPSGSVGYSTVDEKAEGGYIVASIVVKDTDSDIESLSIVSGNEYKHFVLESYFSFTVNTITVSGSGQLDQERISSYNLTVMAVDSGTIPQTSYTSILIYVNVVNNYYPQFEKKEYRVTIPETLPLGSFVVGCLATDQDKGKSGKLTYGIENEATSNPYNWFKIDQYSGLITVQNRIHYDLESQVTLNVSVHDGSLTKFYNFTTVYISILDENDNIPHFSQTQYQAFIEEGNTQGSKVISLTATDADSGDNGTVLYNFNSLVMPDDFNAFSINSNTGTIMATVSLDRETTASYVFEVVASDKGTPPLSSTATVTVHVLDINDEVPVFYPSEYYVNVMENRPIGISVIRVQAFDGDLGPNGTVQYSFMQTYDQFSIDPTTGIIRTTVALSQQQTSAFNLLVKATDNVASHNDQTTVYIKVISENNQLPIFENGNDVFTISEGPAGRQVGKVSSLTPNVSYKIVAGDEGRMFAINENTGSITTNKVIDREDKSYYDLVIVASTSSIVGHKDIHITITDVNDNSPLFKTSRNRITVYENYPVGYEIYIAEATDLDDGINAQITYSLNPSTDLFRISSNTGGIYLQKAISSVYSREYDVDITATDAGGLHTSQQVHITISDVNNHSPVFRYNSYDVSISELAKASTQFFTFSATDQDSGLNGKVSYSISYGNIDGSFGMFPDGKLYIAKELDRETRDHYKLTITARDEGQPPRSSSANITIQIIDENDNRPFFSNGSYTLYVEENKPEGTAIGHVKASDFDVGRNAELSYSLEENQANFTINPLTGEILTARPFDREMMNKTMAKTFYTLTVYVHDNGVQKLSDSVLVDVYVTDVNDNPPIFTDTMYQTALSEASPVNNYIFKVTAVDDDIGKNAEIAYYIVDGNEEGHFSIDEFGGQILLFLPLDRETQDYYLLTVMAKNTAGGTEFTATSSVAITVLDSNDNKPLFPQSFYDVRIPESTSPGTQIAVFKADDFDLLENANISYSLSGQDDDGTFSIDIRSGAVYLNAPLDYESKKLYQLTISAEDNGNIPLSSLATAQISIEDVNDNAPIFFGVPPSVSVSEDASLYTNIIVLSATDRDSGDNGKINFRIRFQSPVEAFNIDKNNIHTKQPLDREKVSSYTLIVEAIDTPKDVSLAKTAEMMIVVNVQDVNDNSPKFISSNALKLDYSDPMTAGDIGKVKAVDPDFGVNGTVTYELISGDSSKFSVDSTSGMVRLLGSLPQAPVTYTVTIKAKDLSVLNQRSTQEDFTIILVPRIQSGLTFNQPSYGKSISESILIGSPVLKLEATSTPSSGNQLEYYITSVVSKNEGMEDQFSVDVSSGLIRTARNLDREVDGASLGINVCVLERQNNQPKATCTLVNITIEDVNDFPPKFTDNVKDLVIKESATTGDVVTDISFYDEDSVGTVSLTILAGNDGDHFSLKQSGSLVISKPLDREIQEKYHLIVVASDGTHSTSCLVLVTVEDVNDFHPLFDKPLYTFDVPEDTPLGTTVGRVYAQDLDLGEGGKVTYSFMSSYGSDIFALDSYKGTFTLKTTLHYEQMQLYILKVKAVDGGQGFLSSSVTVYMNIKDVNDHEPTFDPGSYSAKVFENITVNSVVATVSATDLDTGKNGEVLYSLVSGHRGQFDIDAQSGVIRVIRPLDREEVANYSLVVMATDQAPPPSMRFSATTEVSVIVEDINDSAPSFVTPPILRVMENVTQNNVAFYVTATDPDLGDNGKVSYQISTSASVPFSIHSSTGAVYVRGFLDRESVDQYSFKVIALDAGTPSQSTEQEFIVYVDDVNDNAPVFKQNLYSYNVSESMTVGSSLFSVEAADVDIQMNGQVRYFIELHQVEDDDDFSVDQSSGIVRIKKNLNYESRPSYEFQIMAEDRGLIPKTASTTVRISVLDANDNAPTFLDSPYYALVMENMTNVPLSVITVTAFDADSYPYNMVFYSIVDGNDENIFNINGNTGEITCTSVLDREQKSEYLLIVRARDQGHSQPQLTGTGTVVIRVVDKNDHAPVFSHSGILVAHITENGGDNKEILTLSASDEDDGPNAAIRYSLIDDKDGKFSVNPSSGALVAVHSLDREEDGVIKDMYNLRIKAEDGGSPQYSAVTMVNLLIDDVNDNVPEFEKATYSKTLINSVSLDDFVLGVLALDRDTGPNGQILYTLSGTDALKIDQTSGVLLAARNIADRETITCHVTATDKGFRPSSSSVTVTIEVQHNSLDVPSFESSPSEFELDENTSVGYSISQVTAIPINNGNIRYYIAGGNTGLSFEIDDISGVLKTATPLDHEMVESYELWIEARQPTNPPRSNYKKITIIVKDLNDNPPKFERVRFQWTVEEETTTPLTFTLAATDADSQQNGQLVYSIQSGDPFNNFTINVNTGDISTKTKLDREKIDAFDLHIFAVDNGDPKLTGSTTLHVVVTDINDNPPKFNRQFSADIREDRMVGSFVLQVSTSDADIGTNANVTYSMKDGPGSSLFAIDPHSGNITIKQPLDKESMQEDHYILEIVASDGSFKPSGKVTLFIKDVNDNAPEFLQPLSFNLPEKSPAGHVIGTVRAVDADKSSPNNQMYFSLKFPSDEISINSSTGELTSKSVLTYQMNQAERHTPNYREIKVIATDKGTPTLSSEATVIINILDANDHAPQFQSNEFFSAVPLFIPIGTEILQVLAEDNLDSGVNAEIEYSIVGGDGQTFFSIDKETGVIASSALFSNISEGRIFTLTVKAEDKGDPVMSSQAQVRLETTGNNVFAPVFDNNGVYQASVQENYVDSSAELAKIQATDADKSGPNKAVRYYIVGGDSLESFAIDEVSGSLKVVKALDAETQSSYELNITATDMGFHSKAAFVLFIVSVLDANDNPPVFEHSQYTFRVKENTPQDELVAQLTATDADITEPNKQIAYSIIPSSVSFTIESATGNIKTSAALDYETQRTYLIMVEARNVGTSLKSTTEVRIEVESVNEFYPQFNQKVYKFVINESAPDKSVVGQVAASDKDEGPDGEVYFYLIGSSNNMAFKIQYNTGVITVAGKPDYESSPNITLMVMAKNRGSVIGNDTDICTVLISVKDSNDAPVFSQALYNASIREDASVGVSVIQVAATDNDHNDSDRQFSFTILGGNDGTAFNINAASGLIRVAGKLDRETTSVYNLTVGAVDTGTPQMTGSAMVQINIGDVNDNGPYFIGTPTGTIMEMSPVGTTVINLRDYTDDRDLHTGPNVVYKYQNIAGPHTAFFDISASGIVTTKQEIDRETHSSFTVPVRVDDSYSPIQSSNLTFKVLIDDLNDTPPKPRDLTVQVAINQTLPVGAIADIRPLDDDITGNYVCNIVQNSGDNFETVGNTCDLRINGQPSFTSVHELRIRGSDVQNAPPAEYSVSVVFLPIDNALLENTVVLKIQQQTPENFLKNRFASMKSAMEQNFDNGEVAILYFVRQDHGDVLVFVAARKADGSYRMGDILKTRITSAKNSIESTAGIVFLDIGYSVCTSSICGSGQCKDKFTITSNMTTLDSPSTVLTSPEIRVDYSCTCQPDFSGPNCEIPISPCGTASCQHGGTCITGPNNQKECVCPDGWEGDFCEININECDQNVCAAGSTCEDVDGSFICHCPEGFSGDRCQNGFDSCGSSPCKNGGTCRNLENGYRCECPYAYWGQNCEKVSLGFQEGSFMEFSAVSENGNDFEVIFSTFRQNSLLLYNPSHSTNDFVALEIVNGKVRFSFNLGDNQNTRLTVNKKVADGLWYKVQVTRNKKNASLKVSSCPDGKETCLDCLDGDTSCHASGSQSSRDALQLAGHILSIGGIRNISTITAHPGQVVTHDFIGCMRQFLINTIDHLNPQTAGFGRKLVLDKCPRTQPNSQCQVNSCNNGGLCVDNWFSVHCQCPSTFTGSSCEKGVKPSGLSANSYISFIQKESFYRDKIVEGASAKKRRATGDSQVSIRFRTKSKDGLLFYAATSTDYGALWLNDGQLYYSVKSHSDIESVALSSVTVSDGAWHNVTVKVSGGSVRLQVDNTGEEKTMNNAFAFSSVQVTHMYLGDYAGQVGFMNKSLMCCISGFYLDGAPVSLSGFSDRFIISSYGNIESGCSALCQGSPCGAGVSCTVEGEAIKCGIAQGGSPLSAGVIVVIVFFAILIVTLIIIFVVCHQVRKRRSGHKQTKLNGNAHVNKSFGHSENNMQHDSGFSDQFHDGDFLASQMGKIGSHRKNGRLVTPDILNSEANKKSLPLEMEDGTVIIDDNDGMQLHSLRDDIPEHYDIDNASSIAPSDIDVVTHYRHFREGVSYPHHNNRHHHNHHRQGSKELPMPHPGRNSVPLRESPAMFKNPQMRNSPAMLDPSNLHVNSNRLSPMGNNRQSPMVPPLHHRQSPHIRTSPMGPPYGSSPIAELHHHSRTDSEPSLASHHTYSSTSSIARNAALSNGQTRPLPHQKPPRLGKIPPPQPRNFKGLTKCEVDQLNARPQRPSPESLVEAVSSSSDVRGRQVGGSAVVNQYGHPDLDHLDTSSDGSHNDSFTCSEFENENDKSRTDFDADALIFSKVPEVENENDASILHNNNVPKRYDSDGRNSNGDSFGSSEDGPHIGAKPLNGTFNFDYLLNWGPSFEKLVGVFKDIASLPDGEGGESYVENRINEEEEYV